MTQVSGLSNEEAGRKGMFWEVDYVGEPTDSRDSKRQEEKAGDTFGQRSVSDGMSRFPGERSI